MHPVRTTLRTAVASVESPLQLLAAVEAHAAGLLGEHTQVRTRPGVHGMRATARELTGLGLPDGLEIVTAPGESWGARCGTDATAAVWGIGDAFSGRVQATLAAGAGPREIVLLDDGMATLAILAALGDPAGRLVRPAAGRSRGRDLLASLARRRLVDGARSGRLLAVTALGVPTRTVAAFTALGGRLGTTSFAWLRSRPVPPPIPEPLVVLGSALATDRLIRVEPYLEWVRRRAFEGPVRYVAHRREQRAVLDEIARIDGVHVDAAATPAEMRLRPVGPGHRIVSLPSTAVATCRLALADTGAHVRGYPVPDHWWTPLATPALRAHLQSALDQETAA